MVREVSTVMVEPLRQLQVGGYTRHGHGHGHRLQVMTCVPGGALVWVDVVVASCECLRSCCLVRVESMPRRVRRRKGCGLWLEHAWPAALCVSASVDGCGPRLQYA